MRSTIARSSSPSLYWGIATILGVAVLLRSIGISSRWLWLDELMTVNWSVHGVWGALVNVLRFDIHPPLYYLQLSLWALAGKSDAWLMANSVAWSAAGVALLIYTASRVYDLRTGVFAGLLLAVAPMALSYADDVRMYSFIVFLIVWVWYAQERWLAQAPGRYWALWMIVSQASVAYSHSAGLVMLSGCVLYGAARVLAEHRKAAILRWFAIESTVLILVLPAIAIALARGATHPQRPDLAAFVQTWTLLTSGNDVGALWAVTLGAFVFAYLIILAAFDKSIRLSSATLIFAPIIVAAIISYAFRPMWLPRIFLPVLPFICLNIGVAAASRAGVPSLTAGFRTLGFTLLAAVWAAVGVSQQLTREKGDGYKPAAELVHSISQPGDVVLVDSDIDYWCFNWYYAGPNWGDPRHAFSLNADWARMMQRLPAGTASFLDLSEADRTVKLKDGIVHLWEPDTPLPEASGDVIVVRHQASSQPKIPDRKMDYSAHLQQLWVERWTKL